LAATITTGGHWPDGSPSERGDVLIWSGEDDPSDSLLPRFLASGGDRERIGFVRFTVEGQQRRPFDPSIDTQALSDRVSSYPSIRMFIVDPIVSAVAGDSHKNAEVRRGLQPLVEFAAQSDIAVLGITHFTKGTAGRDPLERVTGSLAFGAMPRVVMATAKPAYTGQSRRFIRAKSNLGPDGGGFEYELGLVPIFNLGIEAQRVNWGEPIYGGARELFDAVEQSLESTGNDCLSNAEEWLRNQLVNGPVAVSTLRCLANQGSLSWRTIERAKKRLGLKSNKVGISDGWRWRLPDENNDEDCRRPPSSSNTANDLSWRPSGAVGGLRENDWEDEI
jgi:hypothetical protein